MSKNKEKELLERIAELEFRLEESSWILDEFKPFVSEKTFVFCVRTGKWHAEKRRLERESAKK